MSLATNYSALILTKVPDLVIDADASSASSLIQTTLSLDQTTQILTSEVHLPASLPMPYTPSTSYSAPLLSTLDRRDPHV